MKETGTAHMRQMYKLKKSIAGQVGVGKEVSDGQGEGGHGMLLHGTVVWSPRR